MDELWKSALAEIELEVSKPTYLTFFKSIEIFNIDDTVVTLSAPTPITAQYIERRYYDLIKKVLDKKLNKNISLLFISEMKTEKIKKDSGPLFSVESVKKNEFISKPKRVRKDYTFDTFAVSDSNQLAYTAALTIANSPGDKYNPLFLYGTVGVGKTHLMNAVANKIYEKKADAMVVYLTTEEFTNEVVEAIRDKTTTQLRKKFRNADLLLLDDVQFLSGKERVQEELFHTFNTLIDKGRQVIFSSDRPPHEIKKIEARLASRFEGGLTVDIQPPDFELRTAILLIKSKKYNMQFSTDMAKLVAEKITDARALEGFLLRLMTEATAKGGQISVEMITRLLGGKVKEENKTLRPDDIIATICSYYNIKQTQLKGSKRDASLVLPRHICMYLLKEEARLPLVEVGNLLGGRDHTTVMHGVEKIKGLLTSSSKIQEELGSIKKRIESDYI